MHNLDQLLLELGNVDLNIAICLGYIVIQSIYLDILKSPQKHFISARPGRENQVSQYF